MFPRLMRTSVVLTAVFLAVAGLAAVARSATDTPTTIEIVQDPAYVYIGDEVSLTATVTPNPGSGVVEFAYGGQIREVVPLEADGTATHVTNAYNTGNGNMTVRAEFYSGSGYAGSFDFLILDMRSLPGVHITNPPTATQSTSVSIAFTVGTGVTTQCRLDGGTWSGCTSPWTASSLDEGLHTFEARGTFGDGRWGEPVPVTWAVDQTAPAPGPLALNHGLGSTNHGDVWLDHPATDNLSGVRWVRVSRTGQLDEDGNLWLDPDLRDSYARRWDQAPGQGHAWSVHMDVSGTQTVWAQWFDFAGNASEIESVTISVRVVKPRLGGLWSTTGDVVPFAITGIQPGEIQAFKIVNTNGNRTGPNSVTVLAGPPSTWNVGNPPGEGGIAGRLRVVVVQWQDQLGQWSDEAYVPIALLDYAMPDVVVDEGATVTPDPIVQAKLAPSQVLRWGADLIQIQYSCDGSNWFGGWWQGSYLPVDVTRVEAGCPTGNGARTLSFRWSWESHSWSDVRQVTINLQRDPSLPSNDGVGPDGAVSLVGGAAAVPTSSITLATPASDGATGVTNVRLSNDGITWTTRSYGPTQPWTLAPGSGSRKVWAQWRDGARNWSEPISTTVVVDATQPTVSGPKLAFATGSRASTGGSIPLKLTWTGFDGGSGVKRYDVGLSTDGGAYASLGSVATAAITKYVAAGHSYRFRVRAVDVAGNVGSWVLTPTVRRSILASGSISYSGSWQTATCSACLGGSQRTSRDAGASARATITGRAVTYIATVGPGYGKARIYVDGAWVATVSLANSTFVNRKLVWSTRWSSVGTHTIRIVVVGPDGGPKVTLDAIAYLR